MSLHTEVNFENEICAWLAAHGWLHDKADSATYDRARAFFPPDVVAWARVSQPQAWDALVKSHGAAAETTLLDRLRKTKHNYEFLTQVQQTSSIKLDDED